MQVKPLILCVEPGDTHSGANSVVSASHRITNGSTFSLLQEQGRSRGGAQVSVLVILAMVGCKAPESGFHELCRRLVDSYAFYP